MGRFYDKIPDEDSEYFDWIKDQKMFWVATAPISSQGHVNVSPKGRPALNLVGSNACWYVDLSGSGNETISHLYENKRITIMFVALEGPANIMRLFGTGKVFERGSPEFNELLQEGDERFLPGTRAIIWVDIHKVSTSCGWTVPLYEYQGERTLVEEFFGKLQDNSETRPDGIASKIMDFWNKENTFSVDGLQGLKLVDDPAKAKTPPFQVEQSKIVQHGTGYFPSTLGQGCPISYEVMLLLSVFILGLATGKML